MDSNTIALLAVVLSLVQVAVLRIIDYYYPRGHTRIGDKIEETRSQRTARRKKEAEEADKEEKPETD